MAAGETSQTTANRSPTTSARSALNQFIPNRAAFGVEDLRHAFTVSAMLQQPAFSLISSVPSVNQQQNDYYVTWTSATRY